MPLLPQEPCLFPDDLLSRSPDREDGLQRWWVLHTRPRVEKTLARRFWQGGMAFFLPQYQRQWRSRGRLLRSFMPLFPGYVFLHGNEAARLIALETNLLVRVLPVADQGSLHGDLARVHHLITSGLPLEPNQRLEPGTRVEIISGPLVGLQGKVLRDRGRLRFFVEVQFLQRAVSVEIESSMIQPLDSRWQAVPVSA